MDIETSVTKRCEVCGKIKPIGDFSKSYRNRCKECVAEHTRNMRALNKIAKTGAFGFTYETKNIGEQLALDAIKASINILHNELDYRFKFFSCSDKIVAEIIEDYEKEIRAWLEDKKIQYEND